nr:unnamed protein product [Spirometra erinaceieuropaei]
MCWFLDDSTAVIRRRAVLNDEGCLQKRISKGDGKNDHASTPTSNLHGFGSLSENGTVFSAESELFLIFHVHRSSYFSDFEPVTE